MSAEDMDWQEIDFRSTSEGYDVSLRYIKALEQEKKLGLIVTSITGIEVNLIFPQDKALEAFNHPTVTPAIQNALTENEVSLWDEALDEYNRLKPEDKAWALHKAEKIAQGGKIGSTLLLATARKQRESRPNRQLPRAA